MSPIVVSSLKLRILQFALELLNERLGGYELEGARSQSRTIRAGVPSGASNAEMITFVSRTARTRSALTAPSGVLGFDRQLDRLVLAQVVACPQSIEQIKSKLAAERPPR